MEDSSEPRIGPKICNSCGNPLEYEAGSATETMCPRCLMARAMQPTVEEAGTGRPEAPSLEEVSSAFADLEIEKLIGLGGMGAVFKARQTSLDRWVALKILPQSLAADSKFAERFESEGKALAALSHPNIVTIHNSGYSGGFYYLLMEFVDGVNLRELLQSRKLTPEEALSVIPPLCDALQFAHDRGVVHRDIKPENLLLDKDGNIKVADFGIAKIVGNGASASEKSAGTPGYMAPEQTDAPERVDSRADIYSLGVVLYEMLTGERPQASNSALQAPSKKVTIDVRLDEIVLRALEGKPELRWQTAADLRTQVETLVDRPREKAGETATESDEPAIAPMRPLGVWRLLLFGLAIVATGIFALPVREFEAAEVGMNETSRIGVPGSAWILEWKTNVAGGWQSGTELLPFDSAWPSWLCAGIAVLAWITVIFTLPRHNGKPTVPFRKANGKVSLIRATMFWSILFSGALLSCLLLIALIASFGRGAPSPLSSAGLAIMFATMWIVSTINRSEMQDVPPAAAPRSLTNER